MVSFFRSAANRVNVSITMSRAQVTIAQLLNRYHHKLYTPKSGGWPTNQHDGVWGPNPLNTFEKWCIAVFASNRIGTESRSECWISIRTDVNKAITWRMETTSASAIAINSPHFAKLNTLPSLHANTEQHRLSWISCAGCCNRKILLSVYLPQTNISCG